MSSQTPDLKSDSDALGPLQGLLVVDATTVRGEMAGRILADLGATVLKIEPPEGVDSRNRPPFVDSRTTGSVSLYWASVGRGKRSIAVDFQSAEQLSALKSLVWNADVFIESFEPGLLRGFGLDADSLTLANPTLVYCSVTPFGQDGPLAHSPAAELTVEAAGGLLGLQGDGDRPNLPVGFPQAWFHAGAQAAADITVALHERTRSGMGQYLDVSAQAAMVGTLLNATGYPPAAGGDPPGTGEQRAAPRQAAVPGVDVPRVWRCADGWVFYGIGLTKVTARTHSAVVEWMASEGMAPASLSGVQWQSWADDFASNRLSKAVVEESLLAVKAFFATKRKSQLQQFGLKEEILLAAIYDSRDVAEDAQLASRNFWDEVNGRRQPGPFTVLSKSPLRRDHVAEALGASQDELLKAREGRRNPASSSPRRGAFEGLRVVDFSWAATGPLLAKALADHGATVVHVESELAPDVARVLPPFRDNKPGIDNSQFFANFNSSKLGLACNLQTEEGRKIAQRLIQWADIAIESFTPGTMSQWGLDYESVQHRRLIMVSTSLRGQTGPERRYSGYGFQGAALAGIHAITGWPDRPPSGPWGAYTDFITPRFGLAAVAAALIHRERTGLGQFMDLSQVEAGIRFTEPCLLDFMANGNVWSAQGHDSLYAAPHGVFRTRGNERFVALAVETDEQWVNLARTIPMLASFSKDLNLEQRLELNDGIVRTLGAYFLERDAFQAADQLREAGVPAYAVLRPTDLYDDPQLKHREFFVTLVHSAMGPTPYDGLVTKFSATPGFLRSAAPCLGEHTEHILSQFLGYSTEEITDFAARGALS